MVEKLQFVSITGPKEDIDRVSKTYLSKHEIHLEHALTELSGVKDLSPFIEANPYADTDKKITEMMNFLNLSEDDPTQDTFDLEEAAKFTDSLYEKFDALREQNAPMEQKRTELQGALERITPYVGMNFSVSKLLQFKNIAYRFGRIPREYYEKFKNYIYENPETIFYKSKEDKDFVWMICFMVRENESEIDALYKSMHFEQTNIMDEYEGTPTQAVASLKYQIDTLTQQLAQLQTKQTALLQENQSKLIAAKKTLDDQAFYFDIRKMAACTTSENTFYILCGWMTKKDANAMSAEMSNDENVYCLIGKNDSPVSDPPTKLKNPKIFHPFEMYIEMYGLPNYHEIDPTIFVSLTYAFIFGWMFGDVGQGIVLMIAGFALYFLKKVRLGGIIGTAGIFSTFFGFMFGSVFGFENVIHRLWLSPTEAMSNLPFIGRLNTIFVVAIAFGMILMLLVMVFNMINSYRTKNLENGVFSANGLAGFIFYGTVVLVVVLFMTGKTLPAGILLAILLIIPVLCIGFKEQITNAIEKKQSGEHVGIVMLILQTFFELFETMLSYFSNTLSFVRVGAFAVSHVAMMEVVMMLAGAEAGAPNPVVVVIGNIIVIGMEGLIVGIQVLRLEYYELFSRFYKGDGRKFMPFKKTVVKAKKKKKK